MRKLFLMLTATVVLTGIFFSSCKKEQIKPEKKITKLEYLKQLTGNDNFIESFDKSSNISNIVADSLNGVLYKYYPDKNDKTKYQNIIITKDSIDYNYIVKSWWIDVINIGTLYGSTTDSGEIVDLLCAGMAMNCCNITIFGDDYILY